MTGWFTYFINVIVYFISISEYFAKIILPELNVLFLDKFFQPIFHCKCLNTYHTHHLTLFSWGFLQLCSTEVHLYHLCHIFLSNVSCQHVATFILSFNGLFFVHFHSVDDFFSSCCLVLISLFFKSHLHNYFFPLNINVLLVIFDLII